MRTPKVVLFSLTVAVLAGCGGQGKAVNEYVQAGGTASKFNAVATAEGDPAFCGELLSYLVVSAKRDQEATQDLGNTGNPADPKFVAYRLEAAVDARAASAIPGLPADIKMFLADTAKLNERIVANKGQLTEEDNALGRKALGSIGRVMAKIGTTCPETTAANEAAS
jgi:hypothetical protein